MIIENPLKAFGNALNVIQCKKLVTRAGNRKQTRLGRSRVAENFGNL